MMTTLPRDEQPMVKRVRSLVMDVCRRPRRKHITAHATGGSQTLRASKSNPVDSLKME